MNTFAGLESQGTKICFTDTLDRYADGKFPAAGYLDELFRIWLEAILVVQQGEGHQATKLVDRINPPVPRVKCAAAGRRFGGLWRGHGC